MLSKSAARTFFLIGTISVSVVFVLLTLDTIRRVPAQTREQNLTPQVVRGKHLWERNNCMGCHTLLGEGAYYAPELTRVYERRGPEFIKAMLRDPQTMYPGQRRMIKYPFTDEERDDLTAFLKWIGEIDLNGFPPKPTLVQVVVPAPTSSGAVMASIERPKVFNQMCIACHTLGGQGGVVGPALDEVGQRRSYENLVAWISNPQQLKPGTLMPKLPLSDADIAELASFLSKIKQP